MPGAGPDCNAAIFWLLRLLEYRLAPIVSEGVVGFGLSRVLIELNFMETYLRQLVIPKKCEQSTHQRRQDAHGSFESLSFDRAGTAGNRGLLNLQLPARHDAPPLSSAPTLGAKRIAGAAWPAPSAVALQRGDQSQGGRRQYSCIFIEPGETPLARPMHWRRVSDLTVMSNSLI